MLVYSIYLKIAKRCPNNIVAYGLHPHNAKDYTDEIEERIIRNMAHPKTVAW